MLGPSRSTSAIRVVRRGGGTEESRKDRVAVEEPMEIRLAFLGPEGPVTVQVAVTMRTPGEDFELAAGFLFTEGILRSPESVVELTYCRDGGPQEYNVVEVRLREGTVVDPELLSRNFYTSSSCGVCGKASIDAVEAHGCTRLPDGGPVLPVEDAVRLPDLLRDSQRVFERTGGLHAAGLFAGAEPGDGPGLVREDVGRHNAVDKVVGRSFLDRRLPLSESVLVVSGRASFEIVQKAVAAGIPVLAAVGAPSSLAVETARRFNMTLLGFVRGGSLNVYTGEERLA